MVSLLPPGARALSLTGGEPTLHADAIIEAMAWLRGHGFRGLFTFDVTPAVHTGKNVLAVTGTTAEARPRDLGQLRLTLQQVPQLKADLSRLDAAVDDVRLAPPLIAFSSAVRDEQLELKRRAADQRILDGLSPAQQEAATERAAAARASATRAARSSTHRTPARRTSWP